MTKNSKTMTFVVKEKQRVRRYSNQEFAFTQLTIESDKIESRNQKFKRLRTKPKLNLTCSTFEVKDSTRSKNITLSSFHQQTLE